MKRKEELGYDKFGNPLGECFNFGGGTEALLDKAWALRHCRPA